jgi:hypothetical protein
LCSVACSERGNCDFCCCRAGTACIRGLKRAALWRLTRAFCQLHLPPSQARAGAAGAQARVNNRAAMRAAIAVPLGLWEAPQARAGARMGRECLSAHGATQHSPLEEHVGLL